MTANPAAEEDWTTRAPLPYRGELDGLRGIAVMAVVLHAFGLPLSGGFTGIDVLLVLVGFLIGGALWREYDATLEIRGGSFLMRTIGRHAPPVFAMLVAVAALGWVLLLPDEFAAFSLSAISSVLMVSNLMFWAVGQPVDGSGVAAPLLHTWPVALTIQLIALTALLFLMFMRNFRLLLKVLAAACVASFVACVVMTPASQGAAVYLPPFRAWEFLSGALLAIWGHLTDRNWRGRPALASLGAVLLVASFLLMPQMRFFPGLAAIIPVAGTLLLIANGAGRSVVSRLLCHRWVRLSGQMSFALYLWHWPVLILGRHLRGGDLGPSAILMLFCLTLALAWLTTRFVDRPLTMRPHLHERVLPASTVATGIVTLVACGAIFMAAGLPGRFGPNVHMHLAAAADIPDKSRCVVPSHGALMGLEVCRIGPSGEPRVLVWGDEQADALRLGLDAAANAADTPGIILSRRGCPPVFGLRKTEPGVDPSDDLECSAANMQIRQALGQLGSLDTVLLAGRWAFYSGGRGVELDAERTIAIRDFDELRNTLPQPLILTRDLQSTVALLRQRVGHVFVMRQVPEIPMYDARIAAREAAHAGLPFAAPQVVQTTVARNELALRSALADAPWVELSQTGDISLIDGWPRLCETAKCSTERDGQSLYRDNSRLAAAGARILVDLFAPVFQGHDMPTIWMGASEP